MAFFFFFFVLFNTIVIDIVVYHIVQMRTFFTVPEHTLDWILLLTD